ncbi:hypothetical protein GCM10023324_01400 [Streptomyces youssoufiensis]
MVAAELDEGQRRLQRRPVPRPRRLHQGQHARVPERAQGVHLAPPPARGGKDMRAHRSLRTPAEQLAEHAAPPDSGDHPTAA